MTTTTPTASNAFWQGVLDFSGSQVNLPFNTITISAWDGLYATAALNQGYLLATAQDFVTWAASQASQMTAAQNLLADMLASGDFTAANKAAVQMEINTFADAAASFTQAANNLETAAGNAGVSLAILQIGISFQTNDQYVVGSTSLGALFGYAGGELGLLIGESIAGAFFLGAALPEIALGMFGALIVGFVAGKIGEAAWETVAKYLGIQPGDSLTQSIATLFTAATQARPRDPLVFQLNGSSLETTGVSTTNPVYFDFSGNGVQSDTGWIGPDNAFLVLNTNGSTSVTNGAQLVTTFAELSAIANGQSIINSSNPAFANLELWVGSNGSPGSGQLVSLSSLGITSINVASTTVNQTLANGNQVLGLGSFNYANGATGTIADVNLVQNSFLSQFTTPLDTSALQSQFTNTLNTSAVAGLPDIQGSGQVRSLLEAATLSPALATLLAEYQTTTSYSARLALVPAIIQAWSDTSTMAGTFTGAYAGDNLTVNINHQPPGSSQYNATADQLTILEHFNGRTFNAVPVTTGANVTVNLFNTTIPLLQASYNALSTSVFQSLELQTALQPYLNAIILTTTSTGMSLDFSGLDALLAANQLANPVTALSDLIELNQFESSTFYAEGWDGLTLLRNWAQQAISSGNTPLEAVLRQMNVILGSGYISSGPTDSILLGTGNNETIKCANLTIPSSIFPRFYGLAEQTENTWNTLTKKMDNRNMARA